MNTTKKIIAYVLFIGITATLLSFQLPEGWFKAGSKPGEYDMGMDKGAGQDGKNVATIRSHTMNKINGFGVLMQFSSPGKYLGQRVRFTGIVKTNNVIERAGLWFRVDADSLQQALSFDDMSNRPITGTTEWQKYEIVLDVPQQATKISYGGMLAGTGQIWFDNLNFEIVDSSVPITARKTDTNEPSNLNFEK